MHNAEKDNLTLKLCKQSTKYNKGERMKCLVLDSWFLKIIVL